MLLYKKLLLMTFGTTLVGGIRILCGVMCFLFADFDQNRIYQHCAALQCVMVISDVTVMTHFMSNDSPVGIAATLRTA